MTQGQSSWDAPAGRESERGDGPPMRSNGASHDSSAHAREARRQRAMREAGKKDAPRLRGLPGP